MKYYIAIVKKFVSYTDLEIGELVVVYRTAHLGLCSICWLGEVKRSPWSVLDSDVEFLGEL